MSDDALEQRVTGRVPVAVVDHLQPDDVDVGHDERCARAAATVKRKVEFDQARRTGARPGQGVAGGVGRHSVWSPWL